MTIDDRAIENNNKCFRIEVKSGQSGELLLPTADNYLTGVSIIKRRGQDK